MGLGFGLLALVTGPGPERFVWLTFAGACVLIGVTQYFVGSRR
jgi:hypothetical protein